jgi:UDP-N-acetylmuramoyl-tripeptide--D-alanyl-D-alanine ligase
MIAIDVAAIREAVDGAIAGGLDPATVVSGPVAVDSRRCGPGALFVALPGERVDGHDYAVAALEAGAVAVLAARDVGVPAVVVDDPQVALGRLARAVLDRASCRVVGVTGSSGKTSTKDLLAQVFEEAAPTVAPESSLNNEIGLPLTVLRVADDTRTLVLEYSARGAGHIAYLCTIAPPDIAIVLNVGVAHLGEFGSREAIARAKGELVAALPRDGVAVLNADDPLVAAMAQRTTARVTTFGTDERADVRVADLDLDAAARPRFRLVTPAGQRDVALQLAGAHQALNAAAVVAAALAAGLELDLVTDALQEATARSPHRMDVQRRSDGLLVIDDAYNANPESARAAIDALVALGAGRRRWAVLGEMLELGPDAPQMHADVGRYAAGRGVEEVVAVGAADPIRRGAESVPDWHGRARSVADADAAAGLLGEEVGGGDAVLVKASNGVRLWRVADRLLDRVPTGADA